MSTTLLYIPATPLDGLVLVQGRTEETPFTVGGVVATSNDRTIKLTVLAVPAHGALVTIDEQTLQVGSTLTMPFGESRIPVTYKSANSFFFSLPEPSLDSSPDEFSYKLEAYDPRTGELIGSSGPESFPVIQTIHIQNVNHPPQLLVPQASVQQTQSLESGKHVAIISGIEVRDSDKDINVVRVDLGVESGTLTLNAQFRDLADFDSCRLRWLQGWRCVGSGSNNREMTFLARPSHVKSILTEMEYVSIFQYNDDSLFVSIFDGLGGDCIADSEQAYSTASLGPEFIRYPSLQGGCYSQHATIDIVALSRDYNDEGSVDKPINRATTLGWAIYIIIGLVAFLVVGFFLRILFFGSGRRQRGASIGPG